ncbi:MAG: hypothetical protein ACI8S6_000625 [Myxococcota bacterium]|jgi:hypothetical protein
MWTWQASDGDWESLIWNITADKHPPLQPVMVWLMRGLSDTTAAARLPSALGALGAAAALFAALRQLVDVRWACWGTLALVLAPMWIAYAGIMRPYALALGCGAGLLWAALATPSDPRRGGVGLALFGTAGLYLHYVMAAPLGAALLGALLGALQRPLPQRRRAVYATLLAGLAAGAAFLPWFAWAGHVHTSKSQWGLPSARVLRYLAFEVDTFASFGMLGLGLLALVGVYVTLRERHGVLIGLCAGAVLLPYLFSSSLEVRIRTYAFIGFLPLLVLLAVLGARRLWPRPLPWAIALVVVMAPEAWTLIRLSSAPFGDHRDAVDDGVHDASRDMALLSSLVPDGTRLVIPFSMEPNIFAHYAPDAVILQRDDAPLPGDWVLKSRRQPSTDQTGCTLTHAFALQLQLPDDAACEQVLRALASEAHPDWLVERALHTDDPAEERALLAQATRNSSWAVPHHLLAQSLVDAGEHTAALPVLRAGLREAMRWDDRDAARSMLQLQSEIHDHQGDIVGASVSRAHAACLRSTPRNAWMPHRCLVPLIAATMPQKKARQPNQQRRPN